MIKQTKSKLLPFFLAMAIILTIFAGFPQLVSQVSAAMAGPGICDILSVTVDVPGVTPVLNEKTRLINLTVPANITSVKFTITVSPGATWKFYDSEFWASYGDSGFALPTNIVGLYEGANTVYAGVTNGSVYKTYCISIVKQRKSSYSSVIKGIYTGRSYDVRLLMQDGTVWSWGSDSGHEGGVPVGARGYAPTRLALTNIVDIALGESYTIYVDEQGRALKPRGRGTPIVIAENIQNAYVGGIVTSQRYFLLDKNNELWGMGFNETGNMLTGFQTGILDPARSESYIGEGIYFEYPEKIVWDAANGAPKIKAGRNTVAVCDSHTLAVGLDGKVYAWGDNGQDGVLNLTGAETLPNKNVIDKQGGVSFATVGAIGGNSYAIDENGKVYGWGLQSEWQLGDYTASLPDVTFVRAATLPSMKSIINGYFGKLAGLGLDGKLYSWGETAVGQTPYAGNYDNHGPYQPAEILDHVIDFGTARNAGYPITIYALRDDNTVWVWGSGFDEDDVPVDTVAAMNSFQKLNVNFASPPYLGVQDVEAAPGFGLFSDDSFTRVLEPGTTMKLEAVISPRSATNQNVIWKSDYPHLATVDPQTGFVTAIASSEHSYSCSTGYVYIYAVSQSPETWAGEPIRGGTEFRITGGVTVQRLDLPSPVGGDYFYTANVASGATIPSPISFYPANASNKKVHYYVVDPDIAAIDENGNITGLSNGLTMVLANADDETTLYPPPDYYYKSEANPNLQAFFYINVSGTAPVYKPGDVNNDGKINMQDVLLIYQNFRGKVTFSLPQTTAADVNKDGKVNMTDVLMVYQYFRGKTSGFN